MAERRRCGGIGGWLAWAISLVVLWAFCVTAGRAAIAGKSWMMFLVPGWAWGVALVVAVALPLIVAVFRRCTLNYFAILSAVMLVACAGMWVRSYWRADLMKYKHVVPPVEMMPGVVRALRSERGEVMFIEQRLGASVHRAGYDWGMLPPGRYECVIWTWCDVGSLAFFGDDRPRVNLLQRLGFNVRGSGVERDTLYPDVTYSDFAVTVPYWFGCAVFAVVPAVWVRRQSRRWVVERRRRGGMCAACGYDLRGLAGGRCPECGAEVVGSRAA
jgi:hypothetical protein